MTQNLHDDLIAAIAEWNPRLAGEIDCKTQLITTARLDSLGLVRLMMWIEERIGRPVDVTAVDLGRDWNDVDSIARFVQQRRTGR